MIIQGISKDESICLFSCCRAPKEVCMLDDQMQNDIKLMSVLLPRYLSVRLFFTNYSLPINMLGYMI